MISLADAVAGITGAGIPLLLPDTCALLDLMRDPSRDDINPANTEAAKRLLDRAIIAPPTMLIALSEQVATELRDNQPRVREETEKKLSNLQNNLDRLTKAYGVHGLPPGLNSFDLMQDFPARSEAVVNGFKAAAIPFKLTADAGLIPSTLHEPRPWPEGWSIQGLLRR